MYPACTSVYPTGDGFERFSEKGFCPEKPYRNFLDGICSRFLDSVFYIHTIQCVIVSLMYFNGNKGKYWKILFVASIAGFFGAVFENFTVAYVCREGDIHKKRYHIVTFLLAEIFWIIIEYSVPFLNLNKMKVFYNGKVNKSLEYILKVLFFLFACSRLFIRYERMMSGLLTTSKTKYGHMSAFGVMALADLICTVWIISYVKVNNKKSKNSDVQQYIKRSCYLILIFVDIVSIFLAIFNGFTELFNKQLASSYVLPFHVIKCSFILILSCDALLFKYNLQKNKLNKNFSNNDKNENDNSFNFISNCTTAALKSIAINNDTTKSIQVIDKALNININTDITDCKK